jgi:hypothetical protein
MIISGRDDAGLLHELAVMRIHGLDMLRPIHYGGQSFKTALIRLLNGKMPPTDLDHQGPCRSCTRVSKSGLQRSIFVPGIWTSFTSPLNISAS